MEEKTNGIKKLFESDKARKIIVIIGIIGIALILFLQFRELIPIKKRKPRAFRLLPTARRLKAICKKSFQVSAAAEKQRCFLP